MIDQIFRNNAYRILELFIHSEEEFSARGIARKLHLSHATVLPYLNELMKIDLISKNDRLYPTYSAADSERFRYYKAEVIFFEISNSGLIERIRQVFPSSIILFGSCANGTYTRDSDIDIFVEAQKTDIDTGKYSKILKKQINLIFESRLSDLPESLRKNIRNGRIIR